MAVLASTELKVGQVFKDEGHTFAVLKYSFMKKGRGQATIRVKVRNFETGSITEKTYSNEQKVEMADVEKRSAQYVYREGNNAVFMDTADFSQFELPAESIEEQLSYLQDGANVVTTFLDGKPLSIEISKSVELKITDTSSAVSGDTATGATKDAILETGLRVQVPLFINTGDVIRVNTDTGEYSGRVNS